MPGNAIFETEQDDMPSMYRTLAASILTGLACAALLIGAGVQGVAVLYTLCLEVVWFTGIRAAVLWARSHRSIPRSSPSPHSGRIALLYCTADDLDERALAASSAQDVPVDVFVLDDSRADRHPDVDDAAARVGAVVIRRPDRTDAKAGNLNHALAQLPGDVDAVVVLDSDTVIPKEFARRAWAALVADPRVACVQAVPVAGGSSAFARFFGPLVRSHARINHATRARVGFPAFVGRGAMLRTAALRDVGGLPSAVSEDLALSVRLRERNWRIVHRPDIEFREDFPIDYSAFRVQQAKAAEGAAEFLRDSGERARALRVRERLDLRIETGLLSLGAAAGLGALAAGTVLAAWGTPTPAGLTLITGVLALMPLLPEALRRAADGALASALAFLLLGPLLYSSVALLIVRHALAVTGGRSARFTVTPKRAGSARVRDAVEQMRLEWAWAVIALVAATALGAAPLAIPFVLPALIGTCLIVWGARDLPVAAPPLQLRDRRTPSEQLV